MMSTILQYFLAGIGTLLLTSTIASLRWLFGLKTTIDKIASYNERRGEQMQVLFKVQLHQIHAQRATLEVVARREENGNVDRAFKALELAEHEMNQHATDNAWS